MHANYGGKINNTSSYVRSFIPGIPANLWKTFTYSGTNVITPNTTSYESLYVPGNLYVDGSIINPSDIKLKQNIEVLNPLITNKLDNLKPSSFTYKTDSTDTIHYGFIAQEFENIYPELVLEKPTNNIDITTKTQVKAINYLELIPLLVHKIQLLETKIKNIEENK